MTEIYIAGTRGTRSVYHTKPDCVALQRSSSQRAVRRQDYPDLAECTVCQNDGEYQGSKRSPPDKKCDACGETYKEIATHLRNCDKL